MINGALFDFDGTIFHIEAVHQHVLNTVLEAHIDPLPTKDEMRAYVGLPYLDRLQHIFAMRGHDDDELTEALEKKARELFEHEKDFQRALVPGITSLLSEMLKAGIRMAVVSSATHGRIEAALTEAHIDHFFEMITGYDDVTTPKPHPQPYEQTLLHMQLQPNEVVAFEDSPTGVESAWLAGIPVIGILTTFEPEDLAKACKTIPDYLELSLADIPSIIAVA